MFWIYYIVYTVALILLTCLIISKNGVIDKILVVITLITLIIDKFSFDFKRVGEFRSKVVKKFISHGLMPFSYYVALMYFVTTGMFWMRGFLNITTIVIGVIFLIIGIVLLVIKKKIEQSQGIAFGIWYLMILAIYITNWVYSSQIG